MDTSFNDHHEINLSKTKVDWKRMKKEKEKGKNKKRKSKAKALDSKWFNNYQNIMWLTEEYEGSTP